jgi:hypothetical protein
MKKSKFILSCLLALVFFGSSAQKERKISKEHKAVIDTLLHLVENHYVYPAVAQKMIAHIKRRQQQHAYDTITQGKSLAVVLTNDLRSISHDGHLGVEYSPTVIPIETPRQPPSQKEIDEFRQQGAMAFLMNSDAIILDLRDNHGFADGGLLVQSYFFKESTHMSDYINRDDGSTRQSWTIPTVPGPKLSDKKLYILVSHDTFSAGEDFTYNMQAQKRAIVIGEVTGGGAHGTRSYRLNDHFSVGIPHVYSVNPITHSDWEGKGIQPDIRTERVDALRTAHIAALQSKIENESDNDRKKALQDLIDTLHKTAPQQK